MKKYYLAASLVFLSILFAGFSDNMKGIFIPSFKEEFLISDSNVSIVLLAASLGYIVCQYIGGVLVEKTGHKNTYFVAFTSAIIGIILIYLSSSFYILVLGILLLTMGVSTAVLCTNALIPLIFVSSQAVFMGIVHFSYGVGVTAGQRTAGSLLGVGYDYRQIYLICGAIAIALMLITLLSKFPKENIKIDKNKKIIPLKEVLKDKFVLLFSFALGFYILAEAIMGTWFINYMKVVYSYDENKGSYYVGIFFFLFAVGRFFGGFIAEKFGYFKTVITFIVLALIFVSTGLIGGEKLIIFMAISGLFFSLIYPVIVTAINMRFKTNTAYILGVILTITSIIGNGMNFVLGYINDIVGTYNGFFIVPISLVISLGICVVLSKEIKRENV
ncbi:MAG: MFS transporter [Clostridium sp.]|uniref:MFS transporter n=1 Tax=Clostridium sp. TaxID=1506 RepID=UPI002FC5A375